MVDRPGEHQMHHGRLQLWGRLVGQVAGCLIPGGEEVETTMGMNRILKLLYQLTEVGRELLL